MDMSLSVPWRVGTYHPVAIEVEGQMVFHVQLGKIQKYPLLYRLVTSHVPSYIYNHTYHGVKDSYCGNPGPFYLSLRAVSQGAGHLLGDYLTFGIFNFQHNLPEKRQNEEFKSLIHLQSVANRFNMDDLKMDCETEIFYRALDMGLMELFKLLEEANYRSDLFPEFSEYLEKRLVGSALDYGVGDSQRAFAKLKTEPSLSVAQMLLKAIVEISDVGCNSDEKNSIIGEVYRRKVAEAAAISQYIGWEDDKCPETRWIKPKSEIAGKRKSVATQFFGPTAQQKDKNGVENSPRWPFQGAPEPTFHPPSRPAFAPLPITLPPLVPRSNETVPRPAFKDQSTTSRHKNVPYARGMETQIDGEWKMKALQRQEQNIPLISKQERHQMAHMAYETNCLQRKHDASNESPAPGPLTTSGEPLSQEAMDNDGDTDDEQSSNEDYGDLQHIQRMMSEVRPQREQDRPRTAQMAFESTLSQMQQEREIIALDAFGMNWSQGKHDASSESQTPGPSTTSGEPLSETATEKDDDTQDGATEASDRPVQIGSVLNLPEVTVTSFDESLHSESSSDTLEGDPVEVVGPMDWDTGSSEYDYVPWTYSLRPG
ncbi:uncharacterized protein FSUBG_1043 [Fusarium subglutinans]|uniref:Uncharacterized protein n=1 Tax=Gibberella subglutinans TaxID=42677 RepID=A0A8H5QFV4_GIBSU|nr:uncharacterized protein FSUBG_1043 [Fusarium subglutinans]KAF5613313.1 hypothetical protein FSUBG_1043 [Fusarium subglutinans]